MRFQTIIVKISLVSILMFGTANGFSQAFVNLDFENAKIIPDSSSPFYPNAINAVPGWTVSGNFNSPDILYNSVAIGSPAVSLQGPGSTFAPVQGNYFVVLQSGNGAVSISQTGLIPSGSQSLIFWGFAGQGNVSFDNQPLTLETLSTTASYDIYGADISAYAGQTGQLLFSSQPGAGVLIDNIQFSPSLVPEPSTWALMLCGAGLFGLIRRNHKI